VAERQARKEPISEAVAQAARAGAEGVQEREGRRRGRPSDAFGGDIRRRDVFPLLVLHLVGREATYGNRLIEEIEEGRWELPDRRTRRYYSITPAGHREYKRLRTEVEPFLDSVIRSLALIKSEVYGGDARVRGAAR
jgi:PadR family transcriptional regulator PadR